MDEIFRRHGVPENEEPTDRALVQGLLKRSIQSGVSFVPLRQRHIGSDRLPEIIRSMTEHLEGRNILFRCGQEVRRVTKAAGGGFQVDLKDGGAMGRSILLAPGRPGSQWLAEEAKRLGIPIRYNPIDIGVRVEVPSVVMDEVTSINWDPKFHIRTQTYDDFVRTFCTCPFGFVVEERYGEFVCVNGHSMRDRRSENTNFAFLTRIGLTEPVEDTLRYGSSIARLATTIGGGKPILQRLADLRKGRRSTWTRLARTYVKPTFRDVTPGDVSMALPQRVVTDITEGLEMLDRVIPGVADDSTLIYAPEIKFHAMRIETDRSLETGVENVFVAGDGAGVSRGIIGAAVTGVFAAEGILRKQGA